VVTDFVGVRRYLYPQWDKIDVKRAEKFCDYYLARYLIFGRLVTTIIDAAL